MKFTVTKAINSFSDVFVFLLNIILNRQFIYQYAGIEN